MTSGRSSNHSEWRKFQNRRISLFVSAVFIVIVVWLLIQSGSQLAAQRVQLYMPLVILAFLVSSSGLLVAVFTWRLILTSFGISQRVHDDLRIYCYSALGVTLPGGIWQVVGRSMLYHRLGANSLQVATASVVETFVIGIAALGVYAISVIFQPGTSLIQRLEIGGVFSILVLLLIHPRVFNRVSAFVLKRTHQDKDLLLLDFGFRELASWIGLEAIVVSIGGLALFVLLTSLVVVPPSVVVQVIAAWAAAVAVSTLFFWLPGTPVVRDGMMTLVLMPNLTLPVALVFVLLARVWAIASLLVLAGLAWFFLDRPQRVFGNRLNECKKQVGDQANKSQERKTYLG